MSNQLPEFLRQSENRNTLSAGSKKQSLHFIDRTLKSISGFIKTGYNQSDSASRQGLFQKFSSWAKVFFLIGFMLIISLSQRIAPQFLIFCFLLLGFISSRINLWKTYRRILLLSILFGFLFSVPASLNIITNGRIIIPLFRFQSEVHFWIYQFPSEIGITREGCFVVLRFFLKVVNSITLTFLIIHTTPFSEIIKSLKLLKVPDIILMTIMLTYKFIFILAQTTEDTYLALKSRWWRKDPFLESNSIIAGRISYIFRKSWVKYEKIYQAMVARGFTGKVEVIYSGKVELRDVIFLITVCITGTICIIL